MRSRLAVAVVVGLGALTVCAATVLATPQSGFTPAQQWKGVFDKINVTTNNFPPHRVRLLTSGFSDVYITRNTIDPGGQSGWHTHPGPSLIMVTAGEITAYEGDDRKCRPTRYTAGQGFVDPGDGHIHLLRNETGAPAETVAIQILPKDATRRIDTPAPGNCPF